MVRKAVAKAFKELGYVTRLATFERVVKSGSQGIAVGDIKEQLKLRPTLSHHLTSLAIAGLIKQKQEGRTLYCVAQYPRLMEVLHFLQDECCADECNTSK